MKKSSSNSSSCHGSQLDDSMTDQHVIVIGYALRIIVKFIEKRFNADVLLHAG
jgi:hypothetical protein